MLPKSFVRSETDGTCGLCWNDACCGRKPRTDTCQVHLRARRGRPDHSAGRRHGPGWTGRVWRRRNDSRRQARHRPSGCRRQYAENLRGRRLRDHRRRTRGIPGRERQARHRVPARLHEEGAAEALCQPRRLPEALERRRAQAGHPRRAGCRGTAARVGGRRIEPGPRSVRPHLSRRLRRQAADPARARRQRQKAERVRPIPCIAAQLG